MSYMVEILLLEQEKILAEADFSSDAYNDLLLIQAKIKEMKDSNQIPPGYIEVLDTVLSTKNFIEASRELNMSKKTVVKKFAHICDRIGKELNGNFTDEGLKSDLIRRYKLTDEECLKLEKFIKKRFQYYRQL